MVLLFTFSRCAYAQQPPTTTIEYGSANITELQNSGSAIVAGQLLKAAPNDTVVPTAITDTSGVVGVAVTGVNQNGASIKMAIAGMQSLLVDGACAVGNSITISSTVAGEGHCVSVPSNQQLGIASNTISSAGMVVAYLYISTTASLNGTITSPNINNIIFVDGVTYQCSGAGIISAISAQIASGGGTVDARGCYAPTISSEIDVGNASSVPITLLVPNRGTWLSTINDGTSYILKVFNNSAIIGSNSPYQSGLLVEPAGNYSLGGICGNDTSVANAHIRIEGFTCDVYGGTTTIAKAIGVFSGLGDGSYIGHMTFENLSASATLTKVLWVNNSCCSTTIDDVVADASGVSGVTPCWFGNGTTGPNLSIKVSVLSCVHQGNSASALVDQEWNQYDNNVFSSIYMETNGAITDLTTAWISVQAYGTPIGADIFQGILAGGDVASSTRYTIDIASTSHVIIDGLTQGTVSTNAIDDHNSTGGTKTAPVNTTIAGYSTEAQYLSPSAYLNNLLLSRVAPTIASGFGTSPSIVHQNGTAAFTINVGTSNTGTGVVTMPTAANGWSCTATDTTTTSTTVSQTKVVPTSATSVTFQNYTDISGTHAWVDSDVLAVNCNAF